MITLTVTVKNDAIEVYLSVDGGQPRLLSLVESARLLSDLALTTSAMVLADHSEQATFGHVPLSVPQKGEC